MPYLSKLAGQLLLFALLLQIAAVSTAQGERDSKERQNADVNAAPEIQLDHLWDGRKQAPFKAMDNPKMATVAQAGFIGDDEYVLGVTLHGESRAYPTRFVWFHHAINDEIGRPDKGGVVPLLVSYCSVCNTGIAYAPVTDDHVVHLDFFGLYNGVVTLCDRDTESVFLQAEGHFVTGPLAGKSLTPLALLDTTWGSWKQLHPDTLVMTSETPFQKYYRPASQPEPRGYPRFPAPYFQPTVTRGDLRMQPFDKVVGVTLPSKKRGDESEEKVRRAYPTKAVVEAGGVVNDEVGGIHVVVFVDPETVTAGAFSPTAHGRRLKFTARKLPDGKTGFYDNHTGSRWNIEGLAVEGKLAGSKLPRIENHLSQWYGWSAYFPNTTIYGRTDAPQPGDPFATAASGPAPQ